MAMYLLGVDHDLLCASDSASHMRTFISANFSPWHLYSNALGRPPHDVDVYIAGPPCVRFSIQGKRAGETDPLTSSMEYSVHRILSDNQRILILENVVGLNSFGGGSFFKVLLSRLEADGYYMVSWHILNSKHFGLPQSRRIIYIIGRASFLAVGTPCFTTHVQCPSPHLIDFLDDPEDDDCCDRLPPASQYTARTDVVRELAGLRRLGLDPSSPDRILDADCSIRRWPKSRTLCPC